MSPDRAHEAVGRARDRKFADSPLEGDGFEPSVPGYGEALRADSLSSEQCGRLRMRRPSEFTAEIKQSRQSAKLAYRNPIDNHGIAATINSETTSAPI
jgi:hypothetical protein